MKLSTLFLSAFVPLAVFAHPVAEEAATAVVGEADTSPTLAFAPESDVNELEKRWDTDAVVKVDGLRYRKCPRTSCTAVGQYSKGTRLKLKCFTDKNTTPVNGDPFVSPKSWTRLEWLT